MDRLLTPVIIVVGVIATVVIGACVVVGVYADVGTKVWSIPAMLAFGVSIITAMLAVLQAVRAVHIDLNSRLTQLLETSGRAQRAEGFRAGQESRDNPELPAID